jgi:hypothetical protein
MCAQPVDKHWFISLNGKRYGPYTYAALAEAAAKGVIDGDTSVWRLGWVKWHPARRVPGLIEESAEPETFDAIGEQPERREDRADADATHPSSSQDEDAPADAPRWKSRRAAAAAADIQVEDQDAPAVAPGWKDQPAEDEDQDEDADVAAGAPRPIGHQPSIRADRYAEAAGIPEVPPQVRDELAPPAGRRAWNWGKRAVFGLLALGLLAGAGWGLFASGLIVVVEPQQSSQAVEPKPSQPPELPSPARAPPGVQAAGNALPQAVAALPAVIALQRNDPAAFGRFSKRMAESATNASGDEILSLARGALRKSVKRLLANAPAETLLEITEVYVGYMQALQTASPESCVALSDESKGASLTSNLAKEFPALFARDMAVLERVAGTDPGSVIVPPTADQARPYLDTVFNSLRQQSVQSELLGRTTLAASEFLPYCALVIEFYEAVLALPPEDRTNMLRFLYAAAASDPEDDVQK